MTEVLVVDDAPMIRQIIDFMLAKHGITVFEADDGETALKRLEQHPDIKAVITDLEMPNMDGKGLTQKLRGLPKFKTIPIIMMVSRIDIDIERELKIIGATSVIGKPLSREMLVSTVMGPSVDQTHLSATVQ